MLELVYEGDVGVIVGFMMLLEENVDIYCEFEKFRVLVPLLSRRLGWLR